MSSAESVRNPDNRVRMVEFSQGNRNEGVSGVRLTICVRPAVIGASLLWLLAVAFMAWDVLDGAAIDEKGRWALLVGIAAGTWTLALVMKHCRRVILEVMSREHLMQMLGHDEDEQTKIRALR